MSSTTVSDLGDSIQMKLFYKKMPIKSYSCLTYLSINRIEAPL